MNHVVVFSCDDWVATYLNGNLFSQGHLLQPMEWLVLGQKVGMDGRVEIIWLSNEQVQDEFPYKLSEIPSEIYHKLR
jgi:hypothetical protein